MDLISADEQTAILATFEDSFDTWSRPIIVFKEPLKTLVVATPSTNNVFGFGETQQDPMVEQITQVTGVYPAVIRDADVMSATAQAKYGALAPELVARILANPISIKVRPDCHAFIENGPTEKIVDIMHNNAIYLINGHGCLQTFLGSEYYVYPLRRSN